MTVWERENKIAEFKRKMQHDLGVALNDDKIKQLLSKTEYSAKALADREKQMQVAAAEAAAKYAASKQLLNMFPIAGVPKNRFQPTISTLIEATAAPENGGTL